jgi:uncharacterized protein YbaR (Trm112 family)
MIPPELRRPPLRNPAAHQTADGVIVTCPVCRRFLSLADRNGRHVASEAHYPRPGAGGTMVCSPLTPAEWGHLTIDAGDTRSPGRTLLTLVSKVTAKAPPILP